MNLSISSLPSWARPSPMQAQRSIVLSRCWASWPRSAVGTVARLARVCRVASTRWRFALIGVVVAISPFNFPVLIPVVQGAMAMACGNTLVLKPSERDPSATLRLAAIFSGAGLPPGLLNIVLVGKALFDPPGDHPARSAIH